MNGRQSLYDRTPLDFVLKKSEVKDGVKEDLLSERDRDAEEVSKNGSPRKFQPGPPKDSATIQSSVSRSFMLENGRIRTIN